MTPTIASTDVIARLAHYNQVDKAGNPYIDHPRAVAELVKEYGPNAVMAALLHDVVEDTHITLDDLRADGYPDEVVNAVDAVTKRPGETHLDAVRRAAADPLGRVVKLADVTHNGDPARLALLDVPTCERLTRKYAKARAVLEAA